MIQFLTIYHNGVTTSRPIPSVILKVYGEIPEEQDCEECSNIWYSDLNKRWTFYQSPSNISQKHIKLSVERGNCYIRKSSVGEIFKYQIIKLGRNK